MPVNPETQHPSAKTQRKVNKPKSPATQMAGAVAAGVSEATRKVAHRASRSTSATTTSSPSSPVTGSASRPSAPRRRHKRALKRRREAKLARSFSKLIKEDNPAKWAPKPEARAEKAAQKAANRLWREAKSVSGLKGKAPEIHLGNDNRVPYAFKGKRVTLAPEAAAYLTKAKVPRLPKQGASVPGKHILLHEFAHVGQQRSDHKPKKEWQEEGRAERFANTTIRKLKPGTKATREAQIELRKDDSRENGHYIKQSVGNYARKSRRKGEDKRYITRGQFKREDPKVEGQQEHTVAKRLKKAVKRSNPPSTLPGLDAEQTQVANTVLKQGQKAGATRQEMLSAVETGIVESGLRNLNYGDADSLGWRQERTSIYGTGPKGPTNVKASAKRYFAEARDAGPHPTAGQLAQATQGSAYPERYDQVKAQAKPVLKTYLHATKPKPVPAKLKAKAKRVLGEETTQKVIHKAKSSAPAAPKKAKGVLAGSRTIVKELVGDKVFRAEGRGDKEPGHAAGGMHDPAVDDAYAADLPVSEAEVDRIAKKLGLDPKVINYGSHPPDPLYYKGYEIEFMPYTHGTGPHIHIGAKWVGSNAPAGTMFGGVSSGATGASVSGVASGPAPAYIKADEWAQMGVQARRKAVKKHRRMTPAQKQAQLRRVARGMTTGRLDPKDYQVPLSFESYNDYAKRQTDAPKLG